MPATTHYYTLTISHQGVGEQDNTSQYGETVDDKTVHKQAQTWCRQGVFYLPRMLGYEIGKG